MMERTSSGSFESFQEAGRRGRSGDNCREFYIECNQVWSGRRCSNWPTNDNSGNLCLPTGAAPFAATMVSYKSYNHQTLWRTCSLVGVAIAPAIASLPFVVILLFILFIYECRILFIDSEQMSVGGSGSWFGDFLSMSGLVVIYVCLLISFWPCWRLWPRGPSTLDALTEYICVNDWMAGFIRVTRIINSIIKVVYCDWKFSFPKCAAFFYPMSYRWVLTLKVKRLRTDDSFPDFPSTKLKTRLTLLRQPGFSIRPDF